MNPEQLAKSALSLPPIILGLTLTEIDLILRIILTCVGIAAGIASFIYYRRRTPK